MQAETNCGTSDPLTGQPANTESSLPQQCVRPGCPNQAVVSPDWEDEYCSNECVIRHCRDIFTKWVQANSPHQEAYFNPT